MLACHGPGPWRVRCGAVEASCLEKVAASFSLGWYPVSSRISYHIVISVLPSELLLHKYCAILDTMSKPGVTPPDITDSEDVSLFPYKGERSYHLAKHEASGITPSGASTAPHLACRGRPA